MKEEKNIIKRYNLNLHNRTYRSKIINTIECNILLLLCEESNKINRSTAEFGELQKSNKRKKMLRVPRILIDFSLILHSAVRA